MHVINVVQGSNEWHLAKAGVITASRFTEARGRLKSGKNAGQLTSEAKNYAVQLAIERLTGKPLDYDKYTTWHMKRGQELEEKARTIHAFLLDKPIEQVGFIKSGCGLFGCSPDGLIDTDGGVEYKCPTSPATIREVLIELDQKMYMDQVQGSMWVSGRMWWELGVYCPFLAGNGRSFFPTRIERDEEYISLLAADLKEFDSFVVEYMRKLQHIFLS